MTHGRSRLLAALLAGWSALVPGGASAQTLRIFHIDVDQAHATLLVSPTGRTLLVDSGKNGHGRRILEALQRAGVSRIDHFVATHYHEDHYGGIDEVIRAGIPVSAAYDRGDKQFLPASTRNGPTFRDYQQAIGHRANHLTRGQAILLDPSVMVLCISSGGVVLGENQPPEHGAHENDMSVGLLVTFEGFRYWVGGDVETPTERKIATLDLVRDLDVYHANHHGADNGSSTEFLADARPRVVVISNGSNATFRHPRASTLARMRAVQPQPVIFQLNRYLGTGDDGGNVAAGFIADPETVDADGTILVEVDAASRSYRVSYGTRVHTLGFRASPVVRPVLIERLLPDPTDGPDRQREAVSLRNETTVPIHLAGWLLRDLHGRVWALGGRGVLGAGHRVTVRREGMAMSLDNTGDTVELLDPTGRVVDAVTYLASQPGAEIIHQH